MTMYDDDKLKHITIECADCGKYCGVYFRENPRFFKELFFCTLKCQSEHKKKNKKKNVT